MANTSYSFEMNIYVIECNKQYYMVLMPRNPLNEATTILIPIPIGKAVHIAETKGIVIEKIEQAFLDAFKRNNCIVF